MRKKYIICGILFVACLALCSIVTKYIVMEKAEPRKDEFVGTYQLDNGVHRFLSIFKDGDSGSKFIVFDDADKVIYEGKYSLEGKSLSMTSDGDNTYLGTLVYSYGDYIFIENAEGPIEVNKISDIPVVPSEE